MTDPITRLITHSGIHQAGLLLDAAELSALLGRRVAITHLRIKPGHNTLVAWRDDETGEHGWTEATVDGDKFANAARRAGRLGEQLDVHEQGDVIVFSGSVWADRKLARSLTGLPREGLHVLRYNPQRRLVAATPDGLVVRVHADSVAHLSQTSARWQRLGIPAISMFGRAHLAVSPWWGEGDLLTTRSAAGSHTAGEEIARLHAAGQTTAGGLTPLGTDPVAAASAIAEVVPELAERAHRLGEHLSILLPVLSADEPLTELHGDLSPDQILVSDTGEIRIIDFDRAGTGPASRDLGSYLAFCRLVGTESLGERFLAGYRAAGGTARWVNVAAWQAYACLTFALTPMRRGEPDWPSRIGRAVTLAEESLDLIPPAAVDVDGESWLVNRAWADKPDALTLELKHPDTGRVRGGRWGSDGLTAHEPGRDPRLELPAGHVVSQRAGKRAVVRSCDGSSHTKVVRAGRAGKIVEGITRAQAFASGFRMPEVLSSTDSTVTLSTLAGRSLHIPELFTVDEWELAWDEVMVGLQRAWAGDIVDAPVHSPTEEIEVLDTWLRKALAFVDDPAGLLSAVAAAQDGLAGLPESTPVPCHRDLHSKQLLWDPRLGAGLLDVDTVCLADPALDLGNLRAHALWRQRQGVWDERSTRAVLTAIDAVPADRAAVRAYEQATLVRLVCVYAFRPRYRTAAMALLTDTVGED